MTAIVITETFLQPEAGKPVAVKLSGTDWMATGLPIFIPFGGFYEVVTVRSSTAAVIRNTGAAGNLFPGSEVAKGLRCVPSGVPGPILAMRWPWLGQVTPTTIGAGMGVDAEKVSLASHLYIRGGSAGGGPNPVHLWASLFASEAERKGHIELNVPNTAKWVVYAVLGYETLSSPQVQAFTVRWLDSQDAFAPGDDVFIQYAANP